MVLAGCRRHSHRRNDRRIEVDQPASQHIVRPDVVRRAVSTVREVERPFDPVLRRVDNLGRLLDEQVPRQEERWRVRGGRRAGIVVGVVIVTAVVKIDGGDQCATIITAFLNPHVDRCGISACKRIFEEPLIPTGEVVGRCTVRRCHPTAGDAPPIDEVVIEVLEDHANVVGRRHRRGAGHSEGNIVNLALFDQRRKAGQRNAHRRRLDRHLRHLVDRAILQALAGRGIRTEVEARPRIEGVGPSARRDRLRLFGDLQRVGDHQCLIPDGRGIVDVRDLQGSARSRVGDRCGSGYPVNGDDERSVYVILIVLGDLDED